MENATAYAQRRNGPIHILVERDYLTLCGRRVMQYLGTRLDRERPAADANWCARCLRNEKQGTRDAWKSR